MDFTPQQQSLVSLAELAGMRRDQEEEENRRQEEERQRLEEEQRQREEEARRLEESERAMRDLKGGYAAIGKSHPGATISDLGTRGGGDDTPFTFDAPAWFGRAFGGGQKQEPQPQYNDLDKVVFRKQEQEPDLNQVVFRKPPANVEELGSSQTPTPTAPTAMSGGSGGSGGMGRSINPRVSIATAMAAALDKSRTRTSLEDQYRRRGFAVSNEGDSIETLGRNMKHNLTVRAAQGDNLAAQELMARNPGETFEDIVNGNTRMERAVRSERSASEERAYLRQMAEQRRLDALDQTDAQRRHDLALQGQKITAEDTRQTRALAAQSEESTRLQQFRENELKIRARQVQGEIDGRQADQLHKANVFAFQKEQATADQSAQRAAGEAGKQQRYKDMMIAAEMDDAGAQGGSKADALRRALGTEKLGSSTTALLPITPQIRESFYQELGRVAPRGDLAGLQRVMSRYANYIAPGSPDAQKVASYLESMGYQVQSR